MLEDKKEELFNACQDGDLQLMKEMLKGEKLSGIGNLRRGSSVYSWEHISLLECAFVNDHMDIVKFLFEECDQNPDVAAYGYKGYRQSVLSRAYREEKYDFVEYLLEKGADVNWKDSYGLSFVWHVCLNDDMEFFQWITRRNPEFFDEPAYEACRNGNLTMMKVIMSKFEKYIVDYDRSLEDTDLVLPLSKRDEVLAMLLTIAAEENYYSIAQLLVGYIKKDQTFRFQKSYPFYAAVTCGNLQIADLLLERLPRDFVNSLYMGRNPIHGCAMSGNIDGLKYALKLGYDINKKDADKISPLRCAVAKENIEIIKILFENGARIEDDLIIEVCKLKNSQMVKLLIDNGANVNYKFNGNTPLSVCLARENVITEIFDLLLKNGADVDPVMDLIMSKFSKNQQTIISVLKHSKNKNSHLHRACSNSLFDVVRYLINSGANPKILDSNGNTLIHSLPDKSDGEILDYLLSKGIDIDAKNNKGMTAINGSVYSWNTSKMQNLHKRGASVITKDNDGNTILHHFALTDSISKFHDDAFKTIINDRNNKGETALFIACVNDKALTPKFLFSYGADPNIPNNDKMYIIHVLIHARAERMIEIIADGGADLNVKDPNGMYPVVLAIHFATPQIWRLLLRKGADGNVKFNGHTKAKDADMRTF